MSEVAWLYAVGPRKEVTRWPLSEGELMVGRETPEDGPDKIGIPGDSSLSRGHFSIELCAEGLLVRCSPKATNPVFFLGQKAEEFVLEAGQHFMAGNTQFQFVSQALTESPPPIRELTLDHGSREQLRERQAWNCLNALTLLLPKLRRAHEPRDLWRAASEILLTLLPRASEILVLRVDRPALELNRTDFFDVLQATGKSAAETSVPPSRRLVRSALDRDETALHLWDGSMSRGPADVTVVSGTTWALAAPIAVSPNENYAVYAVGREPPGSAPADPDELPGQQERVLVDLVAEALSHHLVSRRISEFQAQVGQFFSPAFRRQMLRRGIEDVLAPSRRVVTVLFFDLRGFSRATEAAQTTEVEDAVSTILNHHEILIEVMTEVTGCVFQEDGIVIDYQGDAVLACWGAPDEYPDHALRAVRAACGIAEKIHSADLPFASARGGGRQPMRCGIGLGTGEVVAGQVGARHQLKFGVMGNVVNQASRLEGLTKYLGVPILITTGVRSQLPGDVLCRRIGRVRPAGLQDPMEIHEVVIPPEYGGTGLTASEVAAYERAEESFSRGDMRTALNELRQLPVDDPVTGFLARKAYQYNDEGLPKQWDGVIEFLRK